MDSEKLIQRFLSGQLDEAGQKELADLIENDPELAADLEVESTFYAKRNLDLKYKLKQKTTFTVAQENTPGSTKLIKLISSIAAALLVCVISYFAITNSGVNAQNQLAQEYLGQKHISPVTLMGTGQTKENWSTAIEAYKKDDFQKVVAVISTLEAPTDEQILYSALSKLYLDKPNTSGAIQDLKSIITKPSSLVDDQANWFLALAYLNLSNEKEAEPILKSIVRSKSWNHENASQLLNSIK